MKCPACQRENTADSVYCFYCGTALFSRPPERTKQSPYDATLLSRPTELHSRPFEKPRQSGSGILVPNGIVSTTYEMQRSPTGIEGLDVMIGGGLPKGRVVLISGGPGTGKTTMSLQYLVNGCSRYGENGIFISLDEPLKKILQETSEFGWDLKGLIDANRISFIESPTLAGMPSVEELATLKATIKETAREINAQRICLDPMTFISFHYPDMVTRRKVIMNLFDTLTATGATCIVTNETRGDSEGAILLEEYLADAVIRLTSSRMERGRVRTIEIEKMRGTVIDDQTRAYVIEKNGIKVISQSDLFTYAAGLFSRKITEKTNRT